MYGCSDFPDSKPTYGSLLLSVTVPKGFGNQQRMLVPFHLYVLLTFLKEMHVHFYYLDFIFLMNSKCVQRYEHSGSFFSLNKCKFYV